MPSQQTWTILDLLRATTEYFEGRQLSPARLTAELLLAHALKTRRLDLYLRYDQPCTEGERETYRELVKRRAKGEPAQYITGQAEFWSLPLKVDQRVLIPRPDTEVLVEEALSLAKKRADKELSIADLGTGSGAIALALKKELPQASVFAVDREADALAVARQNAEALSLAIELLHGDLFSPLEGRRFDLVVSNPPYIASAEIPKLQREVGAFEPRTALDGGEDGLDVVRRIFAEIRPYLRPGGACLIEISPEQSASALSLAEAAGFEARVRKDYEGRDRVIVATSREEAAPPPF